MILVTQENCPNCEKKMQELMEAGIDYDQYDYEKIINKEYKDYDLVLNLMAAIHTSDNDTFPYVFDKDDICR